MRSPDYLNRIGNNGWQVQKTIVDRDGNRMVLELVIQEKSRKQGNGWNSALFFRESGIM